MEIKLSNDSEIPCPGLEKYFNEFYLDRKDELVKMKKSLSQKKYVDLKRISHAWKGFCAPYGFGGLTQLCMDLEVAAGIENEPICKELLDKISKYLDQKAMEKENF